jgi:two-component system sensor histidine kinase YesM
MIFKKHIFKNLRLRNKLIISYILLTVIPMSSLGYIAYNQYTKSIEEEVGGYLPRILEQATENINKEVQEMKQLPDLIYNSNQVLEVLKKDTFQNKSSILNDEFLINNYLSQTYINGGSQDILGVFLLSKNRLFNRTKVPFENFDYENSSFPYGQDLDLQGKEVILLPHETSLQFEGNPPFILIRKTLIDYDNRENLGTIFIAVEMSSLATILDKMDADHKSDRWIMDNRGRVIYHTNLDLISTTLPGFKDYPSINGSFRTMNEKENQLISTYKSEQTDWIVGYSISMGYLTERTDSVRNGTIIAFVVFVLISALVSVLLAWNVSKPLHQLTKLMKKVEKGDFDVDLPIQSTKDEVGLLAKSFHSMIWKIKDLIKKNYQIELRQKEAQLYALQSQINPHFMYNTLETIGMSVEEGDNDAAVRMVTILGRMLRYSLNSKEKLVSLSQELLQMNGYLTLQKYRYEERLIFNIHSDIHTDYSYTLKFIFQPIVENAIKYGVEQGKPVYIDIRLTNYTHGGNDAILISIKDNGPGINDETLLKLTDSFLSDPMAERDSKYGLINVHARISMTFGVGFGLQIASKYGEGTEVKIIIPKITSTLLNQIGGMDNEKKD